MQQISPARANENPSASGVQVMAPWQPLPSVPLSPPGGDQQYLALMQEYQTGLRQLASLPPMPTVAIFGSARSTPDHPHYQAAYETARLLARAGFAIITGGGPGIMEAANRGAYEAGAYSIGLPIQLAREEQPNAYLDVAIPFTQFAPRKAAFLAAASAFVIFPGGLGTLDELFEVVLAMQTGKLSRFPLILYGSAFWDSLIAFLRERLAQADLIDASDLELLAVADAPAEAVSLVTAAHLVAEAEPATEPLSPLRQGQGQEVAP
jgi:uncharacterized protein (TIGR00730 family)